MGSKHRLAPRLRSSFATLPPGPAIDAFSAAAWSPTRSRPAAARGPRQRPPGVRRDARRGAGRRQDADAHPRTSTCCARPSRDGRDFIARTFDGLYFPDADHAFLRRRVVARRRDAGRQAGARAQRAVPRGGLEAAARRLHGPPRSPHDGRRQLRTASGGPLRGGVSALQRRRHARRRPTACGDVFALDPAGRARLPRPAVRAAARRHVLRQALPLPRGPGDVLARPGDHVGDAHPQAAKRHTPFGSKRTVRRRARPAVRCTSAARRRSSSPTAPTPTSTPTSSRRCSRATAGSVRRIEIPHRYALRHARRGRERLRPSTCSSRA